MTVTKKPNQKVVMATWFPRDPTAPRGGVESVSANLTAALSRQERLETHIVTIDRDIRSVGITSWNGATIHRLPQPAGSLLRFATGEGRRAIQRYTMALQPDIVHAHDTFGITTRGLAVPRVFTIHGFIHEDTRYRGGIKNHLRSWLWKRAETTTWKEQPHLVSISPYVRERLRGIAQGIIHDIENPIALECFGLTRQEVPNTVFSAAVICERKNTLGLINAFALIADRHPNARLRLAGPITEPTYGERVKRVIAESGLSEKVDLLGSLSTSEVLAELTRASIFALVSFEEGAPMGIAEAMAVGIPILTSNRCGMPYMVRHGETGFLVDPDQVSSIAAHLEKLLADAELRNEMGKRACITALELFHPDRVAARTLRVYQDAIAAAT